MARVSDTVFALYFSAYSPHAIEVDGVLYPTVEHACHCQRYSEKEICDEIRATKSPVEAWKISQKYKSRQYSDFNNRKMNVMETLYRAKLTQHDDVRETLLATGSSEIVKHWVSGPKPDGFWDDGEDGQGRNESGKIWMKLRAEII